MLNFVQTLSLVKYYFYKLFVLCTLKYISLKMFRLYSSMKKFANFLELISHGYRIQQYSEIKPCLNKQFDIFKLLKSGQEFTIYSIITSVSIISSPQLIYKYYINKREKK